MKKHLAMLYLSVVSFFLVAASFMLMPIDLYYDNLKVLSYVAGGMFWMFLILGVIIQIFLAASVKKIIKRAAMRNYVPKIKKRIGITCFFSNFPAMIADIILVLSLIGLTISAIITQGTAYVCYVFFSLVFFSFSMHCVLNGRIYYFLLNHNKFFKVSHNGNTANQKRSI